MRCKGIALQRYCGGIAPGEEISWLSQLISDPLHCIASIVPLLLQRMSSPPLAVMISNVCFELTYRCTFNTGCISVKCGRPMCPRCSNKKPFFNPQWPKQNTALHMVESKLKYNVFAFSLFCISLLYYMRCRFRCYVFSTNFVSWLTKQISNDKPAKLNMRCSNSRLQSTTLEWQLVKDHIAMVWLTPVTASTLPTRLHLLHLQSLLLHLHL